MGILSTITRTGGSGNDGGTGKTYTGGHTINLDRVMAPTDPNAINPMNPGKFTSIRTKEVVQAPRYYSKEEAQQLKLEAKQLTEGATHTRKAYKSLGRIEQADTRVHQAHRNYEGTVSESELDKKRSDAKLAKKLHTQRPQYTRLGRSVERADNAANTRITELTAKIEAMM